ncbi:MAG TPA: hydantoinase B/oxoprolinase family protein [Stellaceae bacterium]|nr:hydantoinase B/oxoprolinase family protein [Stellaceae bacterium]
MRNSIDPIQLEIVWTRLVSAVDEAAATFVRASFSSLVREANDFAVVLADAEGRSLAQSSKSIPSFIGTLPASIKHFRRKFPPETLREGDVLFTNDPWMGSGHIHDVTLATPIFRGGQLIAFAGITSHMPDIGGRLRSSGIRELYEEGLQIPMLKLREGGVTNEAIVAFIRQNVRVPDATMGDIWGQIAACHKCAERLNELLDETDADLKLVADEIISRSDAAMRAAIRAIPDGRYHYKIVHDGFEERIIIDSNVTIDGDRIHIDYTGSSPQLPRAVNVVPIYTFAYTAYGVKALLCPDVPNNEGSFLPVTTSAPEGTILNPKYPAASGARGMIGHLLPVALMGALAEVLPDRVWAPGSANSGMMISGEHAGRRYTGIYFINAGQGASSKRDGFSALSFPSNLSNTPIEVIEGEVPMRVLHRRLRRGSGGSGFYRGGDGSDFTFEFVGEKPAVCAIIMTRIKVPPPGLNGGEPGEIGRILINGVPVDPTEHLVLKRGDIVSMQTAGGGGFGAPPSGAQGSS